MTIGTITVFAPGISDSADLSFTERQWNLAKSTLDNGEELLDYPIDELEYLCNPDNGHCGEEFLLIGGRLHQLVGLSFRTEFYISNGDGEYYDDDEIKDSDTFGSLADALDWCNSKVAPDNAAKCYIFVCNSTEDPDPIATIWNPARYI